MKYKIHHKTVYRYAEPVLRSVHELRLAPRSGPLQAVQEWKLSVPGNLSEARDGFGNIVHSFTMAGPAHTLVIEASGVVDVTPPIDADGPFFCDAPPAGEARVSPLYYLGGTPLTAAKPEMVRFAAPYLAAGATVPALLALANGIAGRVRYQSDSTDVDTSASDAFALGSGVCQDQAQVMVACCRALGVPARYVSGYLLTQPPPGQPRLIGADASHAWVSVFCPVLGWVDFDPTNNVQPALEHITLAWGRDFSDVSPLRGVILGGGHHDPEVRVTVLPVGPEL